MCPKLNGDAMAGCRKLSLFMIRTRQVVDKIDTSDMIAVLTE
jgi:hypothetical protein